MPGLFLAVTLFKGPHVVSSDGHTLWQVGKDDSSGVDRHGHSSRFRGVGLGGIWNGSHT